MVSGKKTFKDYIILCTYIAQGQGQIVLGDSSFIITKGFATLIIHCKFQPLAIKTFCFKIFPQGHNFYLAIERSKVNLGSLLEQIW